MRTDVLDWKYFYILYTIKMYIPYKHRWVCCGCDVTVIYDVTESQTETVWSVNASSVELGSLLLDNSPVCSRIYHCGALGHLFSESPNKHTAEFLIRNYEYTEMGDC